MPINLHQADSIPLQECMDILKDELGVEASTPYVLLLTQLLVYKLNHRTDFDFDQFLTDAYAGASGMTTEQLREHWIWRITTEGQ